MEKHMFAFVLKVYGVGIAVTACCVVILNSNLSTLPVLSVDRSITTASIQATFGPSASTEFTSDSQCK
jgi:hypothetical protein